MEGTEVGVDHGDLITLYNDPDKTATTGAWTQGSGDLRRRRKCNTSETKDVGLCEQGSFWKLPTPIRRQYQNT